MTMSQGWRSSAARERRRSVDALMHDVIAAARQRADDERLVGGRVFNQQQFEQWRHNTRAKCDGPELTLGERKYGQG